MSENVPKTESDEVLEAVKRLVAAPKETATPAPANDTPARARDERLLLTPSLRVEDAAPPLPEPDESAALAAEGYSLEDRIADLEAAVGSQDTEFEPDGSELIDEETPRRFVFQHTPIEDFAAPAPVASVADPAEVAAPEPAAPPERAPIQLATPVALPEPQPEPEPDPEPIPLRPDRSEENAFDVGLLPEPTPDQSNGEADPQTLEISEELEIDEDMLRDIVSEIVRSELQGELGERITRNVRKLVRREIHRAIMTRDFS